MIENNQLVPDRILPALRAHDAQHAYRLLASHAAQDCGYKESALYRKILEQDRVTPCGIGNGVAIAHLRLTSARAPYILFAMLAEPLAFNSLDGAPVDLMALLISPAEDTPSHLFRLSRMTRLLKDKSMRKKLRGTESADAIRALFMAQDFQCKAA